MTRLLRILATALITAGLVIALDVGLTLAWEEPLSNIYATVKQNQAEDELKELQKAFPDAADFEAARGAYKPRGAGRDPRRPLRGPGRARPSAIGRIKIPAIDVDDRRRRGHGHGVASERPWPLLALGRPRDTRRQGDGSAFPGQGKTVGIAGHRTTYKAPVQQDWTSSSRATRSRSRCHTRRSHTRCRRSTSSSPTEIGVVQNVGYERLVLSACHPLYSAAQRIITFAKLKEISLFGSGERIWQDP